MTPEQDASFEADSAVGRYWLLHCEGFEVDGPHAPVGVVEEVVPDTDVGDVLVVRRRTPVPPRIVEVRAERIASIHPWEERIVLRGRRASRTAHARAPSPEPEPTPPRPARERALGAAAVGSVARVRAHAAPAARSAGSHSAGAARAGARGVRRAALAFVALLAAAGAVVARLFRRHWPRVRRALSTYGREAGRLTRAYAQEARRVVREERVALAAWIRHLRSGSVRPELPPLRRAAREEGAALAAWAREVRRTRPPLRRHTRPQPADEADAADAETLENAVTERHQAAS
jgi:hypothetical protein